MGSIALVEKDASVYYNGINMYNGVGHVGAGGWGVRERSANLSGSTVLSLLYTAPMACDITYVSFRVDTVTGVGDEVKFSIWKKTATGTSFIKVTSVTIDQTMVDAQYGSGVWGVATNKIYTIELDDPIHLNAEVGYTYYVAVYSTGCALDYDTSGSINGAYHVAADMSASATYLVSALTQSNWAVSFECFTEPDRWEALTYGGAISAENTDWQSASYVKSNAGEWGTVTNIYDGNPATVSTSTANGDALYIDVSGDSGLPTGSGWDPSINLSQQVFPDYTAYGVRCLSYIVFDVDLGASGNEVIYIQVNDNDVASATPWTDIPTGWQTMYTITGSNGVTGTVYIPVIARWVRFVKGGADTNQCDINEIEIHSIMYDVDDGDFPINMVNSYHHCWVENYPNAVKIMKAAVKNMAGGVGTPGLPFTNRENVD
jgi:hypothetical protein